MDKRYFYALIFLGVLLVGGGIYFISSNKTAAPQTTSLPIPTISDTIEQGDGTSPTSGPAVEAVATSSGKVITMGNGLQIQDEVVGTGVEATSGKKVTVNYVGTLADGTKFDSSYDRGTPFTFNLGAGEVIAGWDQGVIGMKVGGKRKLTIPSSLGYGATGAGGVIPERNIDI